MLILSDDQGWGDLSMHGNPVLQTPVLDALAGDGAQFERFYVSPLCAPTRASLLTGRYALRTGTSWVSKGKENMDGSEVTLGELFQVNGYKTGAFGKWHNGAHYPQHPNQQGFDTFIGFCGGHWSNYFDTPLEHNNKPIPSQGYITDFLTDQAIQFISSNAEQPFLCYLPYNVPHGPFQVPDAYFDKYKSQSIDDRTAAIYGMVDNMDWNIGRLLRSIDSLGLADNTIVVFMTDNGPNGARYNGGMRGTKSSVHEGGVRVPCLVRWPGHIPPGTTIAEAGAHIDMLPTLAKLCNIALPNHLKLDGIDLSDHLLKNEAAKPANRRLFSKKYTEELTVEGAVRSPQYRLVIEQEGDTLLFDMIADPGQERNIAKEHVQVTQELAEAYRTWLDDVKNDYRAQAKIEMAFPQERRVYLPAHEAAFAGHLEYKEGHGWAHDWLVNWKQPTDSIYWEVNVQQQSIFEAYMLYSASEVGADITLSVGDSNYTATIKEVHDPAYIHSPDRVLRQEVYEKEWAELSFGHIAIPEGDQRIVLRAKPKGSNVAEMKSLLLQRDEN